VASERAVRGNTLLPWQIRRILAYIDEHLSEPIRVCNLSALVDLTEGYFSRAFRRRFGAPPHTYIVRRRIQRSARLMLEGNLPLSQVALRCGFSDQAHFNKNFRKLMGTTPAAWRRTNKDHSADLFLVGKPGSASTPSQFGDSRQWNSLHAGGEHRSHHSLTGIAI
jgi:AraC-like DNA-binding protein